MGDYADDLRNDYSHEYPNAKPIIMVGLSAEFEVSIIHRRTRVCHWKGTVMASSKRDAQTQFRKKYAHIRSQYTHEYGLGIKLL